MLEPATGVIGRSGWDCRAARFPTIPWPPWLPYATAVVASRVASVSKRFAMRILDTRSRSTRVAITYHLLKATCIVVGFPASTVIGCFAGFSFSLHATNVYRPVGTFWIWNAPV